MTRPPHDIEPHDAESILSDIVAEERRRRRTRRVKVALALILAAAWLASTLLPLPWSRL